MASTYSTNLGFELPGTGDQAGTWSITNNTNVGTLIEQAISGYVTQAITDGADTVITIPNGSSGVARNMTLELTGALTAARNLIVPANRKLYFIFNNTTGGYAVTVKVSGQTGVSIPNGQKMVLVCNGTDVVTAVTYAASMSVGNLSYTGTLTGGTGIVNLGSGQFYKDASGNVGIGTTSPGVKLTVETSSASEIDIARFRVLNGASGIFLDIGGDEPNRLITFDATGAASCSYVFRSGGVERARLDSSGNLGIGTASPGAKLDVASTTDGDTVRISFPSAATGTAGGGLQFRAWTNSAVLVEQSRIQSICTDGSASYAADMRFMTANAGSLSEKMRLDSSGNLGIGTASPSVASGIGIAVNGGASAARLALKNNSTGDASTDGFQLAVSGSDAFIEQRENASLILSTNGVERMRLDQNGNVIAGGSVALATNATNGFLYVPTCAGVPTGTPGVITGMAPIVVDTTNNKLYFYSGGAWRDAGP